MPKIKKTYLKDENGEFVKRNGKRIPLNSLTGEELKTFTVDNVCDIISQETRLSVDEVRSVFKSLDKLCKYAIPKGIVVTVGTVGKFVPSFKRGRKKGMEVVEFVVDKERTELEGLNNQNRPQMKASKRILTEDKPSYYSICFTANPTMRKYIKMATIEKKYEY